MAKLTHVIYDWVPHEGKDAMMNSAHERYTTKAYPTLATELRLLVQEPSDVASATTVQAEAPVRQGWRQMFKKPKPALRSLAEDTVVVIIAHGSKKTLAVAYEVEGTPHLISAQHLAEMLAIDGLPKNHKYVKLNSCYAAGGDGFTLTETFAQQLAKELGTLGYDHILVGGYQHKLRTPSDPNIKKQSSYSTFDETTGSTVVDSDASGGRSWYDKQGTKTYTGKLADIP